MSSGSTGMRPKPRRHTAKKKDKHDVDIPLTCIQRIVLSPWIHPSLVHDLKAMLKSIPLCEEIDIDRSGLIGSAEWKELGENVNNWPIIFLWSPILRLDACLYP